MKVCTSCQIAKDVSEFHFRYGKPRSHCKVCRCKYTAEYSKDPAHQIAAKQYKQVWHKSNKSRLNKKSKEYALKNLEAIREYKRNYNPLRRVIRKTRYDTDPFFKLKSLLRGGMVRAFQQKGWGKQGRSKELLGCELDIAKQYVERQFKPGMTWGNWGDWHIDHSIPFDSARNEQELRALCHYRNLQPLWKIDNLRKNNKVLPVQTYLPI